MQRNMDVSSINDLKILGDMPRKYQQDDIEALVCSNDYFPQKRRELIRQGQSDELLNCLIKLEELCSEKDTRVQEFIKVLKLNAEWHCGRHIHVERLYQEFNSSEAQSLYNLFTAYILNTQAKYNLSLSRLDEINVDDCSSLVKDYAGVNMQHAVSTWRLWNCGELQDPKKCDFDIHFLTHVFNNPTEYDPKSNSLLFLAAGVFYLNCNDYTKALHYLKNAIIKDSVSWSQRAYSALSVCYFNIKDAIKSEEYLELAIQGVESHFGPTGWQLRIVDSLIKHGREKEAKLLLDKISQQTLLKGEVGYAEWADLYYFVHFPDSSKRRKQSYADFYNRLTGLEMVSALSYLINHKGGNDGNCISSGL